jgi:hypothetical protein
VAGGRAGFDRDWRSCYKYGCTQEEENSLLTVPTSFKRRLKVEWQNYKERSQVYGLAICATSAITGLVFLLGVLRKSYWALAMPVIIGFLGALYVAFWIGRALITTPLEPPAQD